MVVDFIAQRNMADFIQMYEEQLEDPARFSILSFHDRRGAVINDAETDQASMVLNPVGDPAVASLPADRLPPYVTFVTYEVSLDFTPLFLTSAASGPMTLTITAVTKLPQTTLVVLNTDGHRVDPVTVTIYFGPPDIS